MTMHAHGKQGRPQAEWQTLEDHLQQVAEMAAAMAGGFNASDWGRAAGLLHDLGKGSAEFQQRLAGGPPVDHSSAGARKAVELFGGQYGKLLAFALAGHHGGLPDGVSGEGSSLDKRLRGSIPEVLVDYSDLLAGVALESLPVKLQAGLAWFQAAFFLRMVFSCLVDADFLDTERFMDPARAAWRGDVPSLASLEPALERLLEGLLARRDEKPINQHRCRILEACLAAARREPGLFSLTVPTGGGKTFASLAFAFKHALAHGLRRIVYVIPYTSIIEQNAALFRGALGEAAVLEHHSNLAVPDLDDSQAYEQYRRARLATENWDAPLVVTTNVQFFESLFANRPSRCRKLHNLAQSVVILDEAQMLPRRLLLPCLAAIKELATNYRCSLLLMSATQPALSDREILKDQALECREIAPDPARLYQEFRRVRLEQAGTLGNRELADLLREQRQVLAVVNTRGQARDLFLALKERAGDESGGLFHLSALMYPAHRSRKLAEIKQALAQGRPCRVVSTQLIEAGVDLDFPVVYRAMAGLDSIAQAAGRCNREGRLPGLGLVRVFQPEAGPPPGDMRPPAEEAASIFRNWQDPLCLEAMERFFGNLFWRQGADLDEMGIMDLLNKGVGGGLNFSFASAAVAFRLFDSPGESVLVGPDRETQEELIEGLKRQPRLYLRKCQPYLVRLYANQLADLQKGGHLARLGEMELPVLTSLHLYDEDLGVLEAAAADGRPESLIIA